MDVRCEKCQTEYELDEARLKPGGVTVKCTNCGHMFKIRKRSNTNVGAPAPAIQNDTRPRPVSSRPATTSGNILRDDPDVDPTIETGAAPERQWLIRLENGEQKSCRELATLQQWIVAGVVTRESLISRSGKTWKSLGDIAELQPYFGIAEEARNTREQKPTKPPVAGTMLGLGKGPKPQSSGGTIVDDDSEGRTTGTYQARRGTTQPPPPPASTKTPPLGSQTAPPPLPKKPAIATPAVGVNPVNAMATTQLAATPVTPTNPPPVRRPITQPPPPPKPAEKPEKVSTWAAMPEKSAAPAGGRATAVWATDGQKPSSSDGDAPFGGKISAIADEPAFASGKMAGRVRVEPADESSFQTGKVQLASEDDDDDVLPQRQGSRAGLWIAFLVLVLGGGGAALYFLVLKGHRATDKVVAAGSADAAPAPGPDASGLAVTPIGPDAAVEQPADPLEAGKKELLADVESRLRDTMKALDGKDDPEAQALRAHVAAQLAGDLLDRAGLLTEKAEADKLRKDAKTIVIDAATLAQKAHKAKPESGASNLAMAEVLRLQGKRPADIKRYSDVAHADKTWIRDAAIADALVLARDGKLDEAKAAFSALDGGDGDVRARFHLALIAYAQNRPNDAKPLNDQVLLAQPEHAAAHALAVRLETLVAKSDPLPPEDHGSGSATATGSAGSAGSASKPPDVPVASGGSYDAIMGEANKVADSNCTRALELYQKALDLKPDSVEAHTGMGYCFVDQKQFASAQSKFRTALRFSPRYEPALYGIAEAYHQQGRKDDAIEAYKAYLAVYPGTAKAVKALERLGVTDGGGGTPTPTPTPPPPPTPPPTPEPGSGSG